jgi:GT2 family glycosyltransferase
VGFFDERFFMYFEDFDISRRMHKEFKTIFFPAVSIYHGYESGANKSLKLFKVFIVSLFLYFNKHGWLKDDFRVRANYLASNEYNKKRNN